MIVGGCILAAFLFVIGSAAKRNVEMYNGCTWDEWE